MGRLILFLLLLFVASVAYAGDLTLPATFTNGTTADAVEVNANFTAVEAAVDDNYSRILSNDTDISGLQSDVAAVVVNDSNQTDQIGAGTAAMPSGSSISPNSCAAAVTVSATGVASTDVVSVGFNGDPTGVTGYGPGSSEGLAIYAYPTLNNVNFKVCNVTGVSITPDPLTLNWRVDR